MILSSDKVALWTGTILLEIETYIPNEKKKAFHQENITFIKVNVPNNRASKYIKNPTELQ